MATSARRWIHVLALLPLLGFAVVKVLPSQASTARHPQTVLQFHTMIGNDPDQTINDIEADELPWDIYSADGILLTNGALDLRIRGLVFAHDPSVPPELQGTNDSPFFQAVVSCMTTDENGDLVVSNTFSQEFPATTSGNCNILDHVALPNPCIAPVVFVVGDEGAWFAVTGF